MIKPFKVEISDKYLQNIYSKVKNYPWHEMPDDGGWNYGTNLEYMKEFSKYWIENFDWRETEKKINKFENFKSKIDGIDIHFIHEKEVEQIQNLFVKSWLARINIRIFAYHR